MKNCELPIDPNADQPEQDYGKPLLVEWMDAEWFQVWLKLARHENVQAA